MTRFVPNRQLERQLERTVQFREALNEAGEEIAAQAEGFAPRLSGDYADSFEVQDDGRDVIVTNTDWKANLIEWGTSKTPAYAPLRRAVRAAGLRLAEK